MIVFECAGCGAALTAPLSRVALPVHAHQSCGHVLLPPLMEPGTYAVDPEPSGPPWRPWAEAGPGEAEARGIHAPVFTMPDGPADAVVIAPGDARGTVLIPERCEGSCYGPDGRDGPNAACERCARPVATRIDDCSLWQAVWLDPRAVRPVPHGAPEPPILAWDELREAHPATPPVEAPGTWSPVWEAAVAVALAHVLARSGDTRVHVPAGLLTATFGRALDSLLTAGPPDEHLTLAGPGLPPADGGIALVPRHPQTGRTWPPGARPGVPLAIGVWLHLAFPEAVTALDGQARRDDPPPPLPNGPFRPDRHLFLHTLARLPAVREPWLRAIYDRVTARPYGHPF